MKSELRAYLMVIQIGQFTESKSVTMSDFRDISLLNG